MEDTKNSIELHKNKTKHLTSILNSLKIGISSMYENLECKDSLENKETIVMTESNMLKCLGEIEERSNEIMKMYNLCKNKVIVTKE